MSGTECARCGGLVNQEGRCSVCGITRDMREGGGDGARSPQPERADMQMPRRTDSSKQARPAFLFNKLTNESFPLTQSVSKIGRDQTNNISLASDHYISRHHAWVLQMQGGYWVEDLGSTNGTLLNGEVLSERKQIFPGDRITFGKTELVFVVE
jgi:hypothetical protein